MPVAAVEGGDCATTVASVAGVSVAEAGVGAVFLFDEMQLIDRRDLSALLHAAQAVESHQPQL